MLKNIPKYSFYNCTWVFILYHLGGTKDGMELIIFL